MAIEASQQHLTLFLPFVRLRSTHGVAGVEFVPLHDSDGHVPAALGQAESALITILSGYIDHQGNRFDNCVVATIPGRGWDLTKEDFPTVTWAASLLFLAAWAANEYHPSLGDGDYVNSSNFRPVGQGFRGAFPETVSVSARRRDGRRLDGGYEHGEFKFSLPLQCSVSEPVKVDHEFLLGLGAASSAASAVIRRLRTVLPLVELANSDDEWMTEQAEAVLMGSAFEQLLEGDGHAYDLGCRFRDVFGGFGSVRVAAAKVVRPGIEIDLTDPARAQAQPGWWVHQKWMEELYDVRSQVVHQGDLAGRTWGWAIREHLVMAAHVFPLVVKLLLRQEGHYAWTDADEADCLAVDKLLAETQWVPRLPGARQSWAGITSQERRDLEHKRTLAEMEALVARSGGADPPC